jgi:hypothetical protein
MIPLSQVLAYNTDHLIEASAHWEALADQREEVFGAVHNEARTLPWEGLGADALHQRTDADYNTALESAGNLRQAAMIARDGASTLTQMHSRALYTIEDAQTDGFTPTEALQCVDTRPSANPAVAAQRQAQAQAYSGQLQSQVTDLVAHDTKVGADMGNATAGEGKIQFVDHTFKTDGGDSGLRHCSDKDEWKYTLELIGGAGSIAYMISSPPGWVAGLTGGSLAVGAILDGLDGLECGP